jgi:prepilin-type N-terminal cleavage/methylation domain-containing protein
MFGRSVDQTTMVCRQPCFPRDKEEAFTLVELMVVVLIIGILLVIAIPAFLGAKNTADARAAEASLRNAYTAEQTYYTDGQAFTASVPQITTIENGLQWTSGAAPVGAQVLIALDAATPANLILMAQGADGNCYSITDDPSGLGVLYGKATGKCSFSVMPTPTAAQTATGPGTWSTQAVVFPS